MTLRPLAAAVALTSALALSACSSDDPDPVVADPTPSAPSSSADPTPSEDSAEPWETQNRAGAEALVDAWLEAFNAMQSSGQTEAFESLSSSGCATCANLVETTEAIYGGGGSIKSRGWINPTFGDVTSTAKERTLAVRLRQTPQVVVADGERTNYPGGMATFIATVRWTGDTWSMADWNFPA
ncbi:DUF6318 family protein [Nocardioides bruguierae]|uniref:DUF6318 family protein n=1 Tax=Nocardioides bruguierae TaxID=2945102 RepID=UPI0020212E83|nr:DUF6318 family protein [Nocardioides bruguierae]MCL8026246.1 DUF6318 family protein [Nocardioides bruguierae]